MKVVIRTSLYCLIVALLFALNAGSGRNLLAMPDGSGLPSPQDLADAQPQLVKFAGMIDGSGRIIFTRQTVHYVHKHWDKPSQVFFDGAPWSNLDVSPLGWCENGAKLDLAKAWIVKRKGRDVIALEHTPDGFDVYLSDSPNGASQYEITIAIPRHK